MSLEGRPCTHIEAPGLWPTGHGPQGLPHILPEPLQRRRSPESHLSPRRSSAMARLLSLSQGVKARCIGEAVDFLRKPFPKEPVVCHARTPSSYCPLPATAPPGRCGPSVGRGPHGLRGGFPQILRRRLVPKGRSARGHVAFRTGRWILSPACSWGLVRVLELGVGALRQQEVDEECSRRPSEVTVSVLCCFGL